MAQIRASRRLDDMKVELSVVVACPEMGAGLGRSLGALERACAGMDAEILVACPSRVPVPPSLGAACPSAHVVRARAGALVPDLWASGFRASSGRIVAFTVEQCLVGPEWARGLTAAIDEGAAGAGGPLALHADTTPVDCAVYLLRYSAFMPHPTRRRAAEIAGDNAAYVRAALERHAASFDRGFWEVDFHRRIRSEGGYLLSVPEATAAFAGPCSLRSMLRQRYLHGRHSGALRTRSGGIPIWRSLLAAPLVPTVLAARVLGRTLRRRAYLLRALASLPALLALAGAWAIGEADGAWRARARRHPQPQHGTSV